MITRTKKLLAVLLTLIFLIGTSTVVLAKEPVLKEKGKSYKIELLDNHQVRWVGIPEREEVIIGYTEETVWVEEGIYNTESGAFDNLSGWRTIQVPIKEKRWKWEWNDNNKVIHSDKYNKAIEKYNEKHMDYLAGIPNEHGQIIEPVFPEENDFELPLYQVETSKQLSNGEQVLGDSPVITTLFSTAPPKAIQDL